MPRLDAGAIVDEIVIDDDLVMTVRFERCAAGWQASFELTHPSVDGLAVRHRLVAPTLSAARESVPQAVTYLLGSPVDEPLPH